MRQDYAYIARSTRLCLTITEKGNSYYDVFSDKENPADPPDQLLLLTKCMYVVVDDYSDIYNWVAAITKIYSDELGRANPGITRETIFEALTKGFIGFRIAIWD